MSEVGLMPVQTRSKSKKNSEHTDMDDENERLEIVNEEEEGIQSDSTNENILEPAPSTSGEED